MMCRMMLLYGWRKRPFPQTQSSPLSHQHPPLHQPLRPLKRIRPCRPTHTPEPTLTPTPTRFPELLLTPDAPPADTTAYSLVQWSPDHAQNLALLMEAYKDEMGRNFNFSITEDTYYSSFLPASLAYAEARLKFQNDNRIDYWHLAAIANRVMSEFDTDSQLYQDLIVTKLNKGEIAIETLGKWFAQYETEYLLQIDPLQPLPGYKNSYLLSIYSDYNIGNTTFWLLETEDGFLTYPLFNNLGATHAAHYEWEIVDITNDGIDDLLISAFYHSGNIFGGESILYDLSSIPPKQIGFGPETTSARRNSSSTSSQTNENGKVEVQISGGGLVSCPPSFTSTFRWNGQWLDLVDFEISDDEAYFPYCSFTFEGNNWRGLTELEQNKMLQWFHSEFGDIQLTGTDDWRTNEPFLPDAQDEYRFLFAMNHAVLGNVEESQNYLNLIINTPSIPESQWVEPAETFLSIFHSPQDVYKACRATNLSCDLQLAVERVASTLSLSMFEDAIEQLVGLGVPVVANGRFDFDNDGTPEHWFIVQHQPGDDYELWVLAASDEHLKAIFVDTVANLNPTLLLQTTGDPTATDTFQFTIGNDEIYNFIRRLSDREPYVTKQYTYEPYVYQPPPEEAALDNAIENLLAGTNPHDVLTEMQDLTAFPDFEPDNRYYYYLGLTYELLGDEDAAVNAYLQAWQDCCDTWYDGRLATANPYAIMARAKLEPVP